VENLNKAFGRLRVLNGVSLTVQRGQRHVLIGPNGAGKTTAFQCIAGLMRPDGGTILLEDKDVSTLPVHARVSLGMACTFQKTSLLDGLTVAENVQLAVTALKPYRFRVWKPLSRHGDLRQDTREILQACGLWDRRDQRVNRLSYGEQRTLEIALALASKPKVLLLDEPTSGMSPAETAQTTALLRRLPRSMALLVIEHDMDVVFSIADYITVLHHGEVLVSGPPDQIRANERVKEIYLSGGAGPRA